MIKNIFTCICILSFSGLFAQIDSKEALLEVIAKETCDCISSKIEDVMQADAAKVELEFGLCIMESYSKHKKNEDKYLNISFSNDASLEKFGEEIGITMVGYCPNVFMAFAGNLEDEETIIESFEIYGEFSKIKTEQFNLVYFKDNNNREQKMLWFGYFEGSNLLNDTSALKGQKLHIIYEEIELYDPNITDYRNFKVLKKIEKVE